MSDVKAQIPVGTVGRAELSVEACHLADALAQSDKDDFPPVLATMHMIGLMELAGARALHGLLREGELSVGVAVNITHSAPTPIGTIVKAEATFTGMDGKLFAFDVVAYDPGGEIGRGVHKRAIVNTARLTAASEQRRGR